MGVGALDLPLICGAISDERLAGGNRLPRPHRSLDSMRGHIKINIKDAIYIKSDHQDDGEERKEEEVVGEAKRFLCCQVCCVSPRN